MSERLNRSRNLIASAVLPFVLQAVWVWVYKTFAVPNLETVGLLVSVSFVVIGFSFLVVEFRQRSVLIGVLYFPVMLFLLFGLSLVMAGAVYHDFL